MKFHVLKELTVLQLGTHNNQNKYTAHSRLGGCVVENKEKNKQRRVSEIRSAGEKIWGSHLIGGGPH